MRQGCFGRGQRQRMPHKSPCKECDPNLWNRLIAKLPSSSIQSIHEFRFAGDNAYRQAATDDLAVSNQIRANTKHRLQAARVTSKPCNNLVKNQGGAGRFSDLSEFSQKID